MNLAINASEAMLNGGSLKIDPAVKVLIASGFSPSDELHKEINPLVKGFVHKPFGMTQLLDAVGSVLRDK